VNNSIEAIGGNEMSSAKNAQHDQDVMDREASLPLSFGDKPMVSAKPECKVSSCARSAVTDLAGEDLCLDHFFTSCYKRLDELEPVVNSRALEGAENQAAGAFLEECSKRTLVICLRHEVLSNLDRSRLLDILLQAGHLQLQLRQPVIKRAGTLSGLSAIFFEKSPTKATRVDELNSF
jgi:hypothetical protein